MLLKSVLPVLPVEHMHAIIFVFVVGSFLSSLLGESLHSITEKCFLKAMCHELLQSLTCDGAKQ